MALKVDLMQEERHQVILRYVLTHRLARIKDLAAKLDVHEMTVRRDVDTLVGQGLLERVHGGARLRTQAGAELSYQLRAAQNTEAKASIARKALSLIAEGDTVALDASTTGLALAHILGSEPAMAIVTGLDAAEILSTRGTPFILTGGVFHPQARSFLNVPGNSNLSHLHPDKVFFSAKGFALKTGFTDAYLPEVESKIRLIESARLVIALIDHSKFDREALGTITVPGKVDVLITDKKPAAAFREALQTSGTRLLIAD